MIENPIKFRIKIRDENEWKIQENEWKNIESDFGYTISIKLFETDQWCYETDFAKAKDSCNIFSIDGVVMLHKSGPNRARIVIDAEKPWER